MTGLESLYVNDTDFKGLSMHTLSKLSGQLGVKGTSAIIYFWICSTATNTGFNFSYADFCKNYRGMTKTRLDVIMLLAPSAQVSYLDVATGDHDVNSVWHAFAPVF